MFNIKENKGLTLIEFLIYISIVTLILTALLDLSWEFVFGNTKSQIVREVYQNSRFCMEKVTRVMKKALSVNNPSLGSSSSSISLQMAAVNSDPTIFFCSGGQLLMSEGSQAPYSLTSNWVEVSDCLFENISYNNTPGTIRIGMKIDYVNPGGNSLYSSSLPFNFTVSLRPGGGSALPEAYCQGVPDACNIFTDQACCENQEGCLWSPAVCQGQCTICGQLSMLQCLSQDGCKWNWNKGCRGTCTSCSQYFSEDSCWQQSGCSWQASYCSGTPVSCDVYISQVACESQEGCSWIIP